jgi:hypothetical protein
VVGRDRKLRDHNKCKIFREVVTNLFETKIEPAKLLYFLENKCKEKKDIFAYNYAQDTNLLNLRFCIYLLAEELETIINNLDESHGNNYINSIDAKLEKRNEIINYLLKEKAVTQKLFTRMLSIFTNCYAECGDLLALAEVLSDSKEKGRFVTKVKGMQADLQIVDEFKSYAKAYFGEKDINNLINVQREIANPLTREQYLKISDFVPVFDRVDRYQQLLEEYRTLSSDMNLKEENYSRLLKKYDQLLKDFTDLTVQGTKQIINPLGPDDYNQIFAKYKEVKEQDKAEKEQAERDRAASKPKKLSTKKKTGQGTPGKETKGTSPKRLSPSKSKSKTKAKKSKDYYEEDTNAVSFNEPKKGKTKKRVIEDDAPDSPVRYQAQSNPFQRGPDANLSMESMQPTLNNSFKQLHTQDMDLSKISRPEDLSVSSPQTIKPSTQGQKSQPTKISFEDDQKAPGKPGGPSEGPKLETLTQKMPATQKIDTPLPKPSSNSTSKPATPKTNAPDMTKTSASMAGGGTKVEPGKNIDGPKQQTPPQTPAVIVLPPSPPPTSKQSPSMSPKPSTPPRTGPPSSTVSGSPPPITPPPPLTMAGHPGASSPQPSPPVPGMLPPPPGLLESLNQR